MTRRGNRTPPPGDPNEPDPNEMDVDSDDDSEYETESSEEGSEEGSDNDDMAINEDQDDDIPSDILSQANGFYLSSKENVDQITQSGQPSSFFRIFFTSYRNMTEEFIDGIENNTTIPNQTPGGLTKQGVLENLRNFRDRLNQLIQAGRRGGRTRKYGKRRSTRRRSGKRRSGRRKLGGRRSTKSRSGKRRSTRKYRK